MNNYFVKTSYLLVFLILMLFSCNEEKELIEPEVPQKSISSIDPKEDDFLTDYVESLSKGNSSDRVEDINNQVNWDKAIKLTNSDGSFTYSLSIQSNQENSFSNLIIRYKNGEYKANITTYQSENLYVWLNNNPSLENFTGTISRETLRGEDINSFTLLMGT